jgi:spore maturation protein CgeB
MIRREFSVPTYYLDGDMPMSLPAYGGYASGVRGYDGADLSEYEAIITNSQSAEPELLRMGARRALTLHFGADPDLFAPLSVAQDVDGFCYAYGSEEREAAIRHMVTAPSLDLPARFVVAGARLHVDLGRAEFVGPVLTSGLRRWAGRARINLNIVRRPHAVHRASSCMRLFELAAMGCCIVSNPIAGIEEWLEPDREVVVASETEAVGPLYTSLLADEPRRRALGEAARRRVLDEHTYRHRAQTLVSFLGKPAST